MIGPSGASFGGPSALNRWVGRCGAASSGFGAFVDGGALKRGISAISGPAAAFAFLIGGGAAAAAPLAPPTSAVPRETITRIDF